MSEILEEYIHKSRYARFLPKKKRREEWEETVQRYFDFFYKKYKYSLEDNYEELYEAIVNKEVMPSMRAMMTAGEALERDHVAGFNCSYRAIDGSGGGSVKFEHPDLDEPIAIALKKPVDFDEIMYILLCGTGVGFSVERQYINSLPTVGNPLDRSIYKRYSKNFPNVDTKELSIYDRKANTINVADSKYGWASALRILITELYNGNFNIKWDVSKVRPAGAPLRTFGGRASGPAPLESLFTFSKELFQNAVGRKLTSLECHDLVCKVADIVVVGGVRRSALISLSNLTDARMAKAKAGQWWIDNPQRALSNNSVSYSELPDMGSFMKEWVNLYESKSGERGIFSRPAAQKVAARNGRRDATKDFGTNPCSEIILRNKQFCNLSEVVVKEHDTLKSLKKKVEYATILGTLQATLTDFKYLSEEWKKNTEEEALLGVSLTGIMDHPVLNNIDGPSWDLEDEWDELPDTLQELRKVAIETNKTWADKLGINPSAAITCVKPSGTVSQLVNSSSGIHARHSSHYIRTIRADLKDPLTQFMIDAGVPNEPELLHPDSTVVFSFPIKAPETAVCRNDRSAIDQLELWKIYAEHWCEHKPSITISVKEHEWVEVGAWCYKNFDILSGVSFLPYSEHTYQQAPYQECTEEEYEDLLNKMPEIDWSKFKEDTDDTIASQELACTAGSCEI